MWGLCGIGRLTKMVQGESQSPPEKLISNKVEISIETLAGVVTV